MKKYISILLALIAIVNQVPVFAGISAGMKDIETVEQASTVEITPLTKEEYAGEGMVINKNNLSIISNDFEYEVKIKSRTGETEYFTINAKCGDKEYEPINVILSPGKMYKEIHKMENIPQGRQKFSVDIIKSDGERAGSWSKEWSVLHPKKEGFLEKYTRKIGVTATGPQTTTSKWINLLAGRTEQTWNSVEKAKGVYEVNSKVKQYTDDYVEAQGADWVLILNYNNTLYAPTANSKIETKENLDAFADFGKHQAKTYPDINVFEIWNEPNSAFRPTYNYVYTSEVAKNELLKVNKDAKTAIGSVAEGDYGYVRQTFEDGIWPNMDIVANHPYIRPSKVDLGYHRMLGNMTSVITDAGGWREQIITEIGWPTHTSGVTREQSAIELAKQIFVGDYYGILNNIMYTGGDSYWAWNEQDSEKNFGVLFDGEAKVKTSAYTVKAAADLTAGSVFFGKMPFENENIECYVYLADGEITAVMWADATGTEATIDVDFEGQNLEAWDMYGNPIEGTNKFTLVEGPTYIKGFDKEWLLQDLDGIAREYLDKYYNNDLALEDLKESDSWDKAKAIMDKAVDVASKVPKDRYPTQEEVFGYMHENYEVCYELIDAYKNGEIDMPLSQLTGLLYINNWIGNMWTVLAMLSVSDKDVSPKAIDTISEVEAKMKAKAGDQTMSYTKALIDWSEKYYGKAKGVSELEGSNPMKAGAAKAWDMYALELAVLADRLCDAEQPGNDNVLIQLPSSQSIIKIGTSQEIKPSVYNYRKNQSLKGRVELLSPDGKVMGTTEEFEVLPEESYQPSMNVFANGVDEGDYKIRVIENEEILVERTAYITAREVFDVKLSNVTTVFEGIEKIGVSFTNKDDVAFEGKVTIEPLCEWELDNSEPVEIYAEVGETSEAEFNVISKTKTNFNYYPFLVTVYNKDGGLVFKSKELLSFTVINKSDTKISLQSFDGDITGWEDAYPVYLQTPNEPETLEGWTDNEYHTRMLAKWDENGLYMLFDVFDWYHENRQTGASLYNADSIQIAIDPLMNGTVPDHRYDEDDYEYGFAYTEASGNTVYSWHDATIGGKASDKPGEWLHFIRNEELSHSRYLAMLPAANVVPLSLEEGNEFRFNVLYNNTDIGTRSGWWQFTDGIANGKDPEYYWTFKFVDDKIPYDKFMENPIPVISKSGSFGANKEMGQDDNTVIFTDISGHWAEKDIGIMAKSGIINGYGDGTFRPDDSISRVEFIHILGTMNRWNIHDGQGIKHFDDILKDEWPLISRANKLGIVPQEMTPNNMLSPNKPITREEAFAILNRYYGTSGKTTNYKPLYEFKDCLEISDWAAGDVQNMYSNGFIYGNNGYINPKGEMSRAEALSILKRMYAF